MSGAHKKSPMWLPYLNSIKEQRGGVWLFEYNGGVEETKLDDISSIMIYGECDTSLSTKHLEKIARAGVPIVIYRRNLAQPIYIYGGPRPDVDDTITYQLVKRQQSRYCSHIARQLLSAKMRGMSYLVDPIRIPRTASIEKLRNIEAVHAKKYWGAFFDKLGEPEWSRRGKNPASEALDATSHFLAGIILRWITYHHLSPYHGFLHETTDYPSLVYDIMEPYRGIIESELLLIFKDFPIDKWTMCAIDCVKTLLDEKTYVPLTRQIATKHELLHGCVLSLKYYLLGKQRRFLIPLPGKPNGGRPPKVDFMLYGRHAGKTDFWKQAREISDNEQLRHPLQ